MTPLQLRERMEALASLNATVLPLAEALLRLERGSLPERAVAITFDDGCHDFHEHALPILRGCGVPATVYLTTYYVDRPEPVLPLAIDYLLWKARGTRYCGWPTLNLVAIDQLDLEARRTALANRVAAAIRRAADGAAERQKELIEVFASQIGVDPHRMWRKQLFRIMTSDEVLDASRHDVAIELHTHRHRTPRDRTLFLKELSDNRSVIRHIVGRDPRHFCYPSGDVDDCMLPWLEEAGVLSATTCQVALAEEKSHALKLPRYLDSTTQPMANFEGWITGAASFLSRPMPIAPLLREPGESS